MGTQHDSSFVDCSSETMIAMSIVKDDYYMINSKNQERTLSASIRMVFQTWWWNATRSTDNTLTLNKVSEREIDYHQYLTKVRYVPK